MRASKNVALYDGEYFCYIAHVNVHTNLIESIRIPFQNLLMCWRDLVGFPLVERAYVVSEIESMVDPKLMLTLDSY